MAIVMVLCAYLFFLSGPAPIPTFQGVTEAYRSSDAMLLDRHSESLHELRVNRRGRYMDWTPLKDISPALLRAVIHIEDRRFYGHGGIDLYAVAGVLFSGHLRGASTITMQLAALPAISTDKSLRPKAVKRSIRQKWQQARTALTIERSWSKPQILEAYLNLVTFRGELQGIDAASRGLFDKAPGGLNEVESLLLATLISAPNASDNALAGRACIFAPTLAKGTSCEDIRQLTQKALRLPYSIRPTVALAPHVAKKLLSKDAKKVVSTIDAGLQRFVLESLNHHLGLLLHRNVRDGAVLVVENKTGDILAYVGNSGASSSASHVDGIVAKRQAGSSLKPFLYELAIERRLLTAASLLDDSPVLIPTTSGVYVPKNYDNVYRGPVSVRTALSSSLNIPAVRALQLVTVNAFLDRLRALGVDSLSNDADFYGFSLALGSADVTLYELVNAYRTLANGGVFAPLRFTPGQEAQGVKRVADAEAVFIVSSILSDRGARAATFGLESPLATRYWSAVKTGTSKDMRDNWCIGYSDTYTVGVWVGNFSGEPMRDVTGITGAAPVWLDVMNYLHRLTPSNKPQPPASLLSMGVSFDNNVDSDRDEWFIKGTETPAVVSLTAQRQQPHIVYPVEGTIISIDPDIPQDNQLVAFRFQPEAASFQWVLNSKRTGNTGSLMWWRPQKGSFTLAIVGKDGRFLDSVSFQVR
ncbi:penicillin-binding protein 1C [Candidatus Magnetobacterium bavaricum]|uniref:peptidoglycan glycosyltransferase n=1 Tax=Candidatus Magnetobacterium bavaricum TaxID=29290 RepID=A0A0F3GIX7_9BACT|nr:penicillin-binding protein 1C [Candidatus Magnetobacterium bavaricum]